MPQERFLTSVTPHKTGRTRVALEAIPAGAELARFESAQSFSVKTILVLKLDHLGDFLIGLPALQELRRCFADAWMTLVCGSWNVETARRLGLTEDVRAFDYFPQNVQDWNGQLASDAIDRFRHVCDGAFDIAIDLRVDEDTRPLLRHVNAGLRCGIGSRRTHPYLDVILPPEFEIRETRRPGDDELVVRPDDFHSRMTKQTPFFHETDFSLTNTHLLYGPYRQLPLGALRVELAYQLTAPALWLPRVRMIIDVIRHDQSEPIAVLQIPRLPKSDICRFTVSFSNDNPDARYEIRTLVRGKPWWTRLRFFGMRLETVEAPAARYRSAELHIGESLSLLVRLIVERVQPLYLPDQVCQLAPQVRGPSTEGSPSGAQGIVIAPFSNSLLRNWPIDRYIRLIGMLLTEVESNILLVGAPEQAQQLADVQKLVGDDRRLVNLAGRLDWRQLGAAVKEAALVIANNSGVAHLAAACGTPTLAIYSGSHQPQEWGPRGKFVRVLMAAVPCSPCGHDKLEKCPYDHRCMTLIDPETVLSHAMALIGHVPTDTEPAVTTRISD